MSDSESGTPLPTPIKPIETIAIIWEAQGVITHAAEVAIIVSLTGKKYPNPDVALKEVVDRCNEFVCKRLNPFLGRLVAEHSDVWDEVLAAARKAKEQEATK